MPEQREGEARQVPMAERLAAQLQEQRVGYVTENDVRRALEAMGLVLTDADVLAAQVEALTSQLEESRLFHKAANDSRERQRIRANAAEQRAQRAEEALLEVERCANGARRGIRPKPRPEPSPETCAPVEGRATKEERCTD